MSFRDFDAARAERARRETPVRFTLGGETFTCVPSPVIADIFDLADAPEPRGDPESEIESIRAIIRFIERLLVDARSVKRFRKVLKRRDGAIDHETIVELAEWLTEEYAKRPTVPSVSSSDGRPPSTDGSTTSRFDPATAPTAS